MAAGKKGVERIPKGWVDQVRPRVVAGREFQDALREVLTSNAELLAVVLGRILRLPRPEHYAPRDSHSLHHADSRSATIPKLLRIPRRRHTGGHTGPQ